MEKSISIQQLSGSTNEDLKQFLSALPTEELIKLMALNNQLNTSQRVLHEQRHMEAKVLPESTVKVKDVTFFEDKWTKTK